MPYKDPIKRLEWARKKYAKSEKTRELCRLRTERNRRLNKKKYPTKYVYKSKTELNEVQRFKLQARYKVQTEIRAGRMKKLPCIECGEIKSQAHHEDYSKPLEVIWLCSAHHSMKHRKF